MEKYMFSIGMMWFDKKGNKVMFPTFYVVDVVKTGNGVQYFIDGLKVGRVLIGKFDDNDVERIIADDILRNVRRIMKNSLKGRVFESLKLVVLGVNKSRGDNSGLEAGGG